MNNLTRREFVRKTALAAAATQLVSELRTEAPPSLLAVVKTSSNPGAATVHWLEGAPAKARAGTTWGMPWPQGRYAKESAFALRTSSGAAVPVQSWPLAYWPDGTLKWTAHAIPAGTVTADEFEVVSGTPAAPAKALVVADTAESIEIDTGVIQVRLGRSGAQLIQLIRRDGREIARDGRLVCLREERHDPAAPRTDAVSRA